MDYSYVEVMKNKNRMCDEIPHCEDCPLNRRNNGHDKTCDTFCKFHPEEAQEIIMKWAEEHKVKTNLDVFCEVFGVDREDVDTQDNCPFSVDVCARNNFNYCADCKHKGWWQQEYKEA